MQRLFNLYDELCEEICEFSKKYPNFKESEGVIKFGDTLAHFTKNVGKIIEQKMEMEEAQEYSQRGSYAGGMSHRASYAPTNAYRSSHKRNAMGQFSRAGGYSRHGDIAEQLRHVMQEAPDEQTRQIIQRALNDIGA